MFDTRPVTDTEIEQLRIGKLPVTTSGLIYKSFFSQDGDNAQQLMAMLFRIYLPLIKKVIRATRQCIVLRLSLEII